MLPFPKNIRSSLLHQPIYLWLIGIYPILHLYMRNIGLVIDIEVFFVAALALAATAVAFVLTKRLFPDIHTRALILAIWSLAHALSGHIYVEWIIPFSLTVWTLALILMLGLLTFWAKRSSLGKSGRLAHLTATLNIVASVMFAMQLAQLAARIAADLRTESIADAYTTAHTERPATAKALDSPTLPDIYYIIPDAYPSDSWHLEAMNHDNSTFTEALQALGFKVAPHAQSNYSATKLSLPSTLNMRYFDSNPTNFSDNHYLRLSGNNSVVARELLRRGYTFVLLVSGSIGPSPIADINKEFTKQGFIDTHYEDFAFSETRLFDAKESFVTLYIDTTLLRTVGSQLAKLANLAKLLLPAGDGDVEEPGYFESQRFLQNLAELEAIAQLPQATFTIAHLQKPHRPVTFNREGETIGRINNASPEMYFDELYYINQQLLATITEIIEASPRETVIVLQADHGSTYGQYHYKQPDNTYFPIYAGYYLPASFEIEFPSRFTLVNSFVVLLNALFDTGFDLQEDRFFTLETSYTEPFNQREVTQAWLQKTQ